VLRPDLLAKVLESAPDAILLVDLSGRIEFASRQVSALLGYSPEELIGQAIESLLPERFREIHLEHRRHYTNSARFRPMGVDLDLYVLCKDGGELPVEISLSPIRDGEQLLVAAALRDVTDRKRVQSELKLAREEAERANQAKSRFLATASHDLRQPLQSLSLLNGALRRVAKEAAATDAVAQQGQAIDAMSRLLSALLDISKLESGAIRPYPTDFTVATLFEELRTEFASLAAGKGLELRIGAASHCVRSDPSLVGQILRNLLSNAIKYTRTGRVELRAVPQPEAVCVEVVDTGIGIPADQLPHIYDEFYQVGVASNTTREGYGLGLSIVHRLVNLLGLKLEVHSEPGHGSVFALQLPAGTASTTVGRPGCDARPRNASPRASQCILLVEDDLGVRNATSMLLRVEGYRVLPAVSLAEAVQRAQETSAIDLLITDYHLADGKTGLDVIAAARKIVGESMKAIVVSGDTSSTIRDLASDPRIRLASKPVQADELLASVRELLPH
jgi:PAS domain S-box-containing protein